MTAMFLRTLLKTLVMLVLVQSGCGRGSTGPTRVVEQYIAAVEANRPDLAYKLLDEKVRRRVSKNEFIARWRDARRELSHQASQLKQTRGPSEVQAKVGYPSGLQANLIYVDSNWKIQKNVTSTPLSTPTPVEAIKAFIWAVEKRDYQAVMKLVSKSMRETIEREIMDRLDRLKKGLDREIEVTGNKARLRYDRRYKLELIKEGGQWKILDFD
jgi:hypothetical protein